MKRPQPQPKPHALILLADRALTGSEALPINDRCSLLEAAASILPPPLAKAARDEAFHLLEAERSQLTLTQLLREATR